MISAIGSDVATRHPPPPSYDLHGRTHGSGLVSLSRHGKESMGRPQGRPYAAKERLRRWVMEKIGAPGFAAARYSSGLQGTVRLGGSVCLGPSPAWCVRAACDSSGDWPPRVPWE